MADVIEKLLRVQKLDSRIAAVERELRDIPARCEEEQSRLKEHTEELAKAEEALKGKQAEIKELELEAESKQEKINKLRQQQLELKTNKEFQAMDGEIRLIQDGVSALEDRELELMEELEAARGEVAVRESALKEEDALVKADVASLGERSDGLKTELETLRASRAEAAQDVDLEWLSRYDRIVSRKLNALVAIEGNCCGGCHMTLPPSVVNDSKKRTLVVTCNFCGRMLY